VRETIAVVVLVGASILGIVVALPLRTRLHPRLRDVLLALAGAGLGLGGLLLQSDVELGSWIVAPVLLAIVAPLHVRALFARGGPYRI
jgi:hypothetical protein